MIYNPSEIKFMNKTARSKGSVGPNAVVPRVIRSITKPEMHHIILDYGSGPKAIHTKELHKEGFNVSAWEIGENHNRFLHIDMVSDGLKFFDIVFASNVLNVQGERHVHNVIKEVKSLLIPGGKAVFNYPNSPRYNNYNTRHIKYMFTEEFALVEQVISINGLPITPVFVCTNRE